MPATEMALIPPYGIAARDECATREDAAGEAGAVGGGTGPIAIAEPAALSSFFSAAKLAWEATFDNASASPRADTNMDAAPQTGGGAIGEEEEIQIAVDLSASPTMAEGPASNFGSVGERRAGPCVTPNNGANARDAAGPNPDANARDSGPAAGCSGPVAAAAPVDAAPPANGATGPPAGERVMEPYRNSPLVFSPFSTTTPSRGSPCPSSGASDGSGGPGPPPPPRRIRLRGRHRGGSSQGRSLGLFSRFARRPPPGPRPPQPREGLGRPATTSHGRSLPDQSAGSGKGNGQTDGSTLVKSAPLPESARLNGTSGSSSSPPNAGSSPGSSRDGVGANPSSWDTQHPSITKVSVRHSPLTTTSGLTEATGMALRS